MVNKITEEDILNDLKKNVYCRLEASPHGVGVFAVKDIPAGVNPFVGPRTAQDEWIKIPESEVCENHEIPEAVKLMTEDFFIWENGFIYFPPLGMNELGVGYYVNHSKNPNLREESKEFITLREVKVGEELTADYETYTDTDIEKGGRS